MRHLKIANRITNRVEESLDAFLHEISKISLLKPEEEVECAECIRTLEERKAKIKEQLKKEIENIDLASKIKIKTKEKQKKKKRKQVREKPKEKETTIKKIEEKKKLIEKNAAIKLEALEKEAKTAKDRLIKANLRFVVSVAKQYQNQGLSLLDLINEGNLGLYRAVLRFDARKGFKFISYAVWWIRQSILQIISDQGRIVRYPPNKQALLNKINKTYAQLEQEFQRAPSLVEVADHLSITEKEVEEALKNSGRHVSMDAPLVEGEDDSNMYKVLKSDNSPRPDRELMEESLKEDIKIALSWLNEREARVIRYFFGVDGYKSKTLEEIAEECTLTRERCRQLLTQGLKKLRQSSQTLLRDYLGGGDTK